MDARNGLTRFPEIFQKSAGQGETALSGAFFRKRMPQKPRLARVSGR